METIEEDQTVMIGGKEYRVLFEEAYPQLLSSADPDDEQAQEIALMPRRMQLQSIETGQMIWTTDPHIIESVEKRLANEVHLPQILTAHDNHINSQ